VEAKWKHFIPSTLLPRMPPLAVSLNPYHLWSCLFKREKSDGKGGTSGSIFSSFLGIE
jgi:hypothetical protein